MDFYDVVGHVVELLQRQKRVSYRALKRQFSIDDDYIEDLKEELLYAHPVVDDEGRGLIWTGETEATPVTPSQPIQPQPQPVVEQAQSIQATLPPTEPHTPDAERRQLTILFTDLVGSTKLSGQLDAEDYREVVRAYQTTCSEVIERFDCHIAQTLGDGLLIYSGYPVAHENDAERAIRVGLGILDAIQTLNERLDQEKGIRLAVRVGIHTGPVVVGEIGAGTRQCVLETTLALVDKTGERYYEAELHRLKGQLLLQQSPDNHTEAESCFHQAISIAQNQSAKSWELRAATSLARLWQSQYKREESRELLSEIYHWFTEGHDTADLIDAKTLLDELA